MNNIEALHKKFRGEVTTAEHSFYAWRSINNIAVQNKHIYQALNKNAVSWNIITHALQTTFLITLGRILDIDDNALTIDSFLNKCSKEIAQFSKAALETRKRQIWGGASEEELQNYLAEAYEPTERDFSSLKEAAQQHITKYKEIYKPIRNKVIAHKNMSFLHTSGALFAKTNIGDIEATLLFLHQVDSVVWQFLINGHKTTLQDHFLKEDDFVLKDIEQLLKQLS